MAHSVYVCFVLPELSSSPPGPYQQDAYNCKLEERFKSPPILPPHLLQVILNKDTGISVSMQKFSRCQIGLLLLDCDNSECMTCMIK